MFPRPLANACDFFLRNRAAPFVRRAETNVSVEAPPICISGSASRPLFDPSAQIAKKGQPLGSPSRLLAAQSIPAKCSESFPRHPHPESRRPLRPRKLGAQQHTSAKLMPGPVSPGPNSFRGAMPFIIRKMRPCHQRTAQYPWVTCWYMCWRRKRQKPEPAPTPLLSTWKPVGPKAAPVPGDEKSGLSLLLIFFPYREGRASRAQKAKVRKRFFNKGEIAHMHEGTSNRRHWTTQKSHSHAKVTRMCLRIVNYGLRVSPRIGSRAHKMR